MNLCLQVIKEPKDMENRVGNNNGPLDSCRMSDVMLHTKHAIIEAHSVN